MEISMNNLRRNYYPVYKDMGSIIDDFLKTQNKDASFGEGKWAPAVDIREDKERFLVIADLPGVDKENMHISLEKNILTLKGSRSYEQRDNQEGFSRVERSLGQFHRQFTLPQIADESQISAKYKNGILEISIPKKEQAMEKRIDVQIED
jgi:HSP20 family protein